MSAYKYRAELYDEVWKLAKEAGFENVTMVFAQLAALREELAGMHKLLDGADLSSQVVHEVLSKVRTERDDAQQRLADAERRNAILMAEIEVEKINAAHWKATIAGEGQVSKEARRYRGIRDVLPLNELLEVTKDCQSAADWDTAVDAALNKPEEAKP